MNLEAVNQQPWTFTVVRNQGLLDKLSEAAKLHMLANMPGGAPRRPFHIPAGRP
jgi:hypothetical protein